MNACKENKPAPIGEGMESETPIEAPRKKMGRPALAAEDRAQAITIKAHPVAVKKFKAHAEENDLSHRQLFETITKRFKETL